jgi:hypothetical protein
MKKIIALTDYKNRFGSKHFDSPYRSGMDKDLLQKSFNQKGYEVEFIPFTQLINQTTFNKGAFYLYTSSEDNNYLYKSFIEDVVLFIENSGGKIIPDYKYIRANNNKVFMELMRNQTNDLGLLSIRSMVFGTKEELTLLINDLKFPVIVKESEGASGTGVFKASNKFELLKIVNNVSASKNSISDIKDQVRAIKHKGYIKESRHRKKFIVQNMIENLVNDWKIYYFFDKLYVFYRPILKHRDFRASGGGYNNYLYGEEAPKPEGFFEFIMQVLKYFHVPHASLDIAYDGKNFHLIEMQFLYFGTAGIPYSKGYYINENNKWVFVENKLSVEDVYANSITKFIESKTI